VRTHGDLYVVPRDVLARHDLGRFGREPRCRLLESRDGRLFPVTGSSWEDTFGPYESRIYLVIGASAAASNR